MTTIANSKELHERLKSFTTKDVKSLIQQKGNLKELSYEFILKDPVPTDAHLIAVINDPYVEVNPIGREYENGEMYYDLKSRGKQVRIKIECHVHEKNK